MIASDMIDQQIPISIISSNDEKSAKWRERKRLKEIFMMNLKKSQFNHFAMRKKTFHLIESQLRFFFSHSLEINGGSD